MINFVYMLEFKDSKKVYIGLSNDLNWDISIKSNILQLEYNLEVEEIRILSFDIDERIAKIDYKMWLGKTENKNINSYFSNKTPDTFISQTLKDKKTLRQELHKLEDKYTSLFYEFKIMEENYIQLDEIIDRAISESISEWKVSEP